MLPKLVSLTNKLLDDERAINILLNQYFVKWINPPLSQVSGYMSCDTTALLSDAIIGL